MGQCVLWSVVKVMGAGQQHKIGKLMPCDICIADIDGTIAEIPAEAYFIEPIDVEKCRGCADLRIEKEFISYPIGTYSFMTLFKKMFDKKIGIARKYFCHRPSWCENKPAEKIKEMFSAEKVLNFKPIIEVRNVLWQLVKSNFSVIYLSGRPTDILFQTSRWITLNGFPTGLVACVGKDNENPIEGKMKIAEMIILANKPDFIIAYEDCPYTMKMYYEKFGAVDGLKAMKNQDKLLDMKNRKIKASG